MTCMLAHSIFKSFVTLEHFNVEFYTLTNVIFVQPCSNIPSFLRSPRVKLEDDKEPSLLFFLGACLRRHDGVIPMPNHSQRYRQRLTNELRMEYKVNVKALKAKPKTVL